MSTIKKFAGQTAVYGLSTVFSRVLSFFLTKLYVGVYPAKVYGIFTTMYSYASMLNAILAFGMETTFFRYLNKHEDKKEDVYGNSFIIIASLSAVFLTLTILFTDNIAHWMQPEADNINDYISYVKYFIYILVADALAVIPFAKVRSAGKPFRYALIKTTNILVFIGLNLLFLVVVPALIKSGGSYSVQLLSWYKPNWVGYVFISNLIASVFTLLLLLPEILQIKFRFNIVLAKEMLVYSLPVLIANISFIVNENVDKIFLGKLLPPGISEQEVGIYGACCKLAVFLSIFIQAFRLGAEPFFFSHAKNKNSGETYASVMTYFIIAVCIIFIGLVANIEILKYFIKGRDAVEQARYWSGLRVVPILLFGYVSLGIYINLSIWYKLSDQTKFGLYISGVGAIVTVILNLIFIPKYSYMASAWISLTAYAIMMVLSYLLGQKNYPIPYHLKKNLAYIVSSVLVVVLSFYVFNRNLIVGNLFLLTYILLTIFAERKEIKKLFNI